MHKADQEEEDHLNLPLLYIVSIYNKQTNKQHITMNEANEEERTLFTYYCYGIYGGGGGPSLLTYHY